MHVELVRATTADAIRLDGALIEPSDEGLSRGTAILCLHGVGGNFYGSGLFEAVTPALRTRGFTLLWANTRGHDGLTTTIATGKLRHFGAAAEIVDECRLDVAAWIKLLRERGYDRVALLGHSLGAIKALYATARGAPGEGAPGEGAPGEGAPEFVVAASPPSLSYRRLLAGSSGADFRRWIDEARRLLDAGAGDRLFEPTVPFPLVISARTYWDKYGPDERYDFLELVPRVAAPVLFTYGEVELRGAGTPFSGLPERIREIAGDAVDVRVVPGADHNYRRTLAEWSETVAGWIDKRFPFA